METYFASPQKAEPYELAHMAKSVNENQLLNSLLQIVDGCLAILNEHRQIIAVNKNLLNMLGIDTEEIALGLRLGEAVHCIHAGEKPNGCGTTEFCSTCGAAIAMVTSLSKNSPVERTCAITVNDPQGPKDIYFRVRSQPLTLDSQNYLLLFLQDITLQQQQAIIERIFFHDMNNIICGLLNASGLLAEQQPQNDLVDIIQNLSNQISNEILIQQHLKKTGVSNFKPIIERITAGMVMHGIRKTFAKNPLAENRNLVFSEKIPPVDFRSNLALISRILTNMIINAIEASQAEDTIKISIGTDSHAIHFNVWNPQAIDKNISKRIFQRNFSTKKALGRGWGTYSMKLIGEKILNGRVSFISSEKTGTTFQFSLPI